MHLEGPGVSRLVPHGLLAAAGAVKGDLELLALPIAGGWAKSVISVPVDVRYGANETTCLHSVTRRQLSTAETSEQRPRRLASELDRLSLHCLPAARAGALAPAAG